MPLFKSIFILLGTLSLCIGMAGIVIPGLPTTPFVLLTAGLYLKGSDTLYQKLLNSHFPGGYIREYQRNKGMTTRAKTKAIATMAVMITLSILYWIDPWLIKLLVIALGALGAVVILFFVPTAKLPPHERNNP